jgi:hypothetical protein
MNFIKLIRSSTRGYLYEYASSIEMNILGDFLASDVGCSPTTHQPSFKDWALNDSLGEYLSCNLTSLEKEGDNILLIDSYSENEIPASLKISKQQFAKLFDDWKEKSCKFKPKEVIIKYENDQFVFETKD